MDIMMAMTCLLACHCAVMKNMVRLSKVTGSGGRGDGDISLCCKWAKPIASACTTSPPMHVQSCIPCIPCYPCIMHPPSRRLRILLRKASNGTAMPRGDCVALTSAKHWRGRQRLRAGVNTGQCSKAVHIPHLPLGLHTQVDQLCLSAEIFSCTCMPALPAPVDAALRNPA